MRSLLHHALVALLLLAQPAAAEEEKPADEGEGSELEPKPKPDPEPKPVPKPKADLKSKLTLGAITHTGFSAGLDSRIVDAVRKRQRYFRNCHEKALKTAPSTTGKVVLRVDVGSRGHPLTVELTKDGTGNADMSSCLVQRARRLDFPPPDRKGQVTIPLVFTVE